MREEKNNKENEKIVKIYGKEVLNFIFSKNFIGSNYISEYIITNNNYELNANCIQIIINELVTMKLITIYGDNYICKLTDKGIEVVKNNIFEKYYREYLRDKYYTRKKSKVKKTARTILILVPLFSLIIALMSNIKEIFSFIQYCFSFLLSLF